MCVCVRAWGGVFCKNNFFYFLFSFEVLCPQFQLPVAFIHFLLPCLLCSTSSQMTAQWHTFCQLITSSSSFHFFCPKVLGHKHIAVLPLSFNLTSARSSVEHRLCATDMRCCLQLTLCGRGTLLLFSLYINNSIFHIFFLIRSLRSLRLVIQTSFLLLAYERQTQLFLSQWLYLATCLLDYATTTILA